MPKSRKQCSPLRCRGEQNFLLFVRIDISFFVHGFVSTPDPSIIDGSTFALLRQYRFGLFLVEFFCKSFL